jgi:hypothetical protein
MGMSSSATQQLAEIQGGAGHGQHHHGAPDIELPLAKIGAAEPQQPAEGERNEQHAGGCPLLGGGVEAEGKRAEQHHQQREEKRRCDDLFCAQLDLDVFQKNQQQRRPEAHAPPSTASR